MAKVTLADIEAIPKDMLIATDIAPYLGVDAQYLRLQAKNDASKLGFPAIVIGTRVKFPKQAFIDFVKGGTL